MYRLASNLHSPRWSLTVKLSLIASWILAPKWLSGMILTPIRNLRHLIQLELSVKDTSSITATPWLFIGTLTEPTSNGLFPSLAFTIAALNWSAVHQSRSSRQKSPSRTSTSSLTDEEPRWVSGGGIIQLVFASMRWISIALWSESRIVLFVKIGRLSFLAKTSFREGKAGASWIRRERDLIENNNVLSYHNITGISTI